MLFTALAQLFGICRRISRSQPTLGIVPLSNPIPENPQTARPVTGFRETPGKARGVGARAPLARLWQSVMQQRDVNRQRRQDAGFGQIKRVVPLRQEGASGAAVPASPPSSACA